MAERRKPLREIVAELPHYEMIKDKIAFLPDNLPSLQAALKKHFPNADYQVLDGLKLSWENSWLRVRLSNTEPVLRIVAEAKSPSILVTLSGKSKGSSGGFGSKHQ